MGFITRAIVPRSVRRAAHPVRAVRRAVTPNVVKSVSRSVSVIRNPVSAGAYSMEKSVRKIFRKAGSTGSGGSDGSVYNHGDCSVNHRTYDAAVICGGGYDYADYEPVSPRPRPVSRQADLDFIMMHVGGIVVASIDSREQLISLVSAMRKLESAADAEMHHRLFDPNVWERLARHHAAVFGVESHGLRQGFVTKRIVTGELIDNCFKLVWKFFQKELNTSDCKLVCLNGVISIVAIPDAECDWYDH